MKIIMDTNIFTSALILQDKPSWDVDHKYPLYTLDKKLAGAAKKENVLFEIKSDN